MFGPKMDELTEDRLSLYNEMFHDMLAQNILWVIKNECTGENLSI